MTSNKTKILKYLLVWGILFVLAQAKIMDMSPFVVACVFALMWTDYNLPTLIVQYLTATTLINFSLELLYVNIVVVFIVVLTWLIHKKTKKPMNLILVSFYTILSQCCQLYYFIIDSVAVGKIVVYFILLIISLCLFVLAFQVAVLRGVYYKFTINETIAFMYLIICLGLGLEHFNIFGFSILKLIAVLSLLFFWSIKKDTIGNFIVIALAVGNSISTFNNDFLMNIVALLLASYLFKYPQRIKCSICILFADLTTILYFNSVNIDTLFMIMPTLVALGVAFTIPHKLYEKLQDKFYIAESELSMRNIVNLTRKNLHNKFKELSNVFNEMNVIYLSMIKEDLSELQVVNMLSQELKKGMCKDCIERQKCYQTLSLQNQSIIEKLVALGLKKGKITLLDIPTGMSTKCNVINLLIGKINQLISQYGQYINMKKDINNVKYLLAEQLSAVSQIMLNLGDEIDKNVSFDTHKESIIFNELLSENVICSEILLYNEKDDNVSINLIVKGESAFNPVIEKIISKTLKTNMKAKNIEPIDVNGFYSINLVRENNYDIVFGLANKTKDGSTVSGDTHSVIKLTNNKYLVALCDGMGSGEKANKVSASTINLIEDFYKAGFDNNMVIASVNKLISITNQEDFSTLDISIIDLNKLTIDFIKVGAPYSLLKKESGVEKIDGGSLPIGVIENINPNIFKSAIDTKTMVVLATDGITDAFEEYEDLERFVNGIISSNPQVIAETILAEALRLSDNRIKDDMTVLVIKTFKKN